MIGDWILVKYSSKYELDLLGPKKFITQSTWKVFLYHCFNFNTIYILDTIWDKN